MTWMNPVKESADLLRRVQNRFPSSGPPKMIMTAAMVAVRGVDMVREKYEERHEYPVSSN